MKRIKYNDRLEIKRLLDAGERVDDIAAQIGVTRQTMYNEIRRGTGKSYATRLYDPEKAQRAIS